MHFANQVALVIFLLMLITVVAGCSKPPMPRTSATAGSSSSVQGEPRKEETAGQKLDNATAEAKRTAADTALTARVKTALATDAGLKTLKLDVDANGGVVTLKGRVDSDDAKKRIQEIAQAVPGVTWVQNQVSVAPKPA
jgi:osmotically-inducible protein OsmY